MHRFFVSPAAIQQDTVRLRGPIAHQIRRVLRLRPGDRFVVLDDSGSEYTVALEQWNQDEVQGHVVAREKALTEPLIRITLYQALLKGERFEWVLQKGTELGVATFVPLLCARNVVRDRAVVAKRSERWRTIIREAAEQSRRGRLPGLEPPLEFAAACQQALSAGGLSLLAWEEETSSSMKAVLRAQSHPEPASSSGVQTAAHPGRPELSSVRLFIGPEGGFTSQETSLARAHGIQVISLGPRILRAETAGIAAVAVLLYEFGDWE